ncbi:hypothetical protein [Neorhizobium lilium]|nr:hypothetical protein [Neorhizobium lilium]
MNDKTNAAARAAAQASERTKPPEPVSDWKPDPCLLTRHEMKVLIAEKLG